MTGGPYRSLLFDLDGTLAETDSLHLPTWVEIGIASTREPDKLRKAGVFMVAKDLTDPKLRALIGA